MRKLLVAAALLPLSACGIPPNWGAPGTTPPWETNAHSNGKDYPDPHPESPGSDAQRAAYEANQRQQIQQQQSHDSGPDLSQMHCTTTSSGSSGPNAGTMTSSTSCHN
jgi:hypothetical protein